MNDSPIKNLNELSTSPVKSAILDAVSDAISDLDPAIAVRDYLNHHGDEFNGTDMIFFGFGKASARMFVGVRMFLGRIPPGSSVIIPKDMEVPANLQPLKVLRGSHPIIDESSVTSTREILDSLPQVTESTKIVVLISGGGSALFELPVQGIDIKQFASISKCLMNAGANIQELNGIRHAMSQVKGGKLAKRLYPASVTSLIVSDVPGDDLSIIASGPLYPSSLTKKQRESLIESYSAPCPELAEIRPHLDMDFPPPDDPVFKHVRNEIILRNGHFVDHIYQKLISEGQKAEKISDPVTGDVESVARYFAESLRKLYDNKSTPVFIVAGGETTVKVHGNGVGGRNTQLATLMALQFNQNEDFVFASIGTDGIDGISPAMGGITDTEFLRNAGTDEINKYLNNNDTYTLLKKYSRAIISGFTGNNVSDIFVGYYGGHL